MRHEKTFKRDNGDNVKIDVSVYLDNYSTNNAVYRITVAQKMKGKRKWLYVHSSDDYDWRKLDMKGRSEYEMNIYLQYVSHEEIQQAKLELWELMKPK